MDSLFDRVVSILSPQLGETTARASVNLYLRKLGLTPQTLAAEHLAPLAEKLKPGLVVFVGKDSANLLTDQIRNLG